LSLERRLGGELTLETPGGITAGSLRLEPEPRDLAVESLDLTDKVALFDGELALHRRDGVDGGLVLLLVPAHDGVLRLYLSAQRFLLTVIKHTFQSSCPYDGN